MLISLHFISGVTIRIRKTKMTFDQSGTKITFLFRANVSCVNICDRKPQCLIARISFTLLLLFGARIRLDPDLDKP